MTPILPCNQPAPLTPMMLKYKELKKTIPENCLLMFQLGDFYEFFFDDAAIVARILKITLTNRRGVPMAGIPFYAINYYINQFLAANINVAVTENDGNVQNQTIQMIYEAGDQSKKS